jgi:hypothetical protein
MKLLAQLAIAPSAAGDMTAQGQYNQEDTSKLKESITSYLSFVQVGCLEMSRHLIMSEHPLPSHRGHVSRTQETKTSCVWAETSRTKRRFENKIKERSKRATYVLSFYTDEITTEREKQKLQNGTH